MERPEQTLNYIKFFLLVIFFAAMVSIAYKITMSFKNSTFKYGSFNLLVLTHDAYLVHIDELQKKMSVFKINNGVGYLINKSRLYETLKIGIPVDGQVFVKNNSTFSVERNFLNEQELLSLLLMPANYKNDHLDNVDILKIYLLTKQISPADRNVNIVPNLTDRPVIQQNTTSNISDPQIFNDNQSVQIINATGADGVGGALATALKNLGYNVVSVGTGDSKKSAILSDNPTSESVVRLKDYLDFPIFLKSSNSVADITIVLGSDLEKQLEDFNQ